MKNNVTRHMDIRNTLKDDDECAFKPKKKKLTVDTKINGEEKNSHSYIAR